MGEFDPVSWETVEAALGPPAREVEAYVERMHGEVHDIGAYDAVKTIHDALSDEIDEAERSVPGLGDAFVIAYLLEKRGIIGPDAGPIEREYRSFDDRRPSRDRLRELFWERERTLWWIGVLCGVHPSLVSYWCYEDEIPLMERNFTTDSLAQIRTHQESEN